jgi:hypothetical protein
LRESGELSFEGVGHHVRRAGFFRLAVGRRDDIVIAVNQPSLLQTYVRGALDVAAVAAPGGAGR